MPAHPPLIAVFGSSTMTESDAAWRLAFDLGGELARAGAPSFRRSASPTSH